MRSRTPGVAPRSRRSVVAPRSRRSVVAPRSGRVALFAAVAAIAALATTGEARASTPRPVVSILSGPAPVSPTGDIAFTFEAQSWRYAYSVDGGRFSASLRRPHGIWIRALADGRHVVRIRARQGDGRPGPTLVDRFRVDGHAPRTSWRGAWTADSRRLPRTASLAYRSSTPGSTFQCAVDTAQFDSCPSTMSLSRLSLGRHVVRIRAVSPAGVIDRTPLRRVIDVVSSGAMSGHGLALSMTATGTPVFSDGFESGSLSNWAVTTSGDGTAGVQSAIVDDGTYAAQFTESANAGSRAYARYTLPAPLANATLTEDVRVDAQGPSSSQSIPLVRFFDGSGNRVVNVYRQNQSGRVGIQLSGGTFVSTSSVMPLATWESLSITVAGTSVQLSINGTLVYATTSANVAPVAVLQIGNEVAAQLGTSEFDDVSLVNSASGTVTPPDTTITSPAPGTGSSASITFTSNETGTTFQCSLDGAPWAACSSPDTLSGLTNGSHTFQVAAVDSQGNVDPTPASVTWTTNVTGQPALLVADNKRRTIYIVSYTGQVLWSWNNPLNQTSSASGPLGVHWLPNGDILATFGTGTVGEINPATKTFVWKTVGNPATTGYFQSPYDAGIMPDGNLLVSVANGSDGGHVVVFNRSTGAVNWWLQSSDSHSATIIPAGSPGSQSPYTTILNGSSNMQEIVYNPGGPNNFQVLGSYGQGGFYHYATVNTAGDVMLGEEPATLAELGRNTNVPIFMTQLTSTNDWEVRGIAQLPDGSYAVTHCYLSGGGQIFFVSASGTVTGKLTHFSNGDYLQIPYQIQSIPNYTG